MSSAGERSREWRFYVTNRIEFAKKVRAYTSKMDQATFVADARTYDAAAKMPVRGTCHECRRSRRNGL